MRKPFFAISILSFSFLLRMKKNDIAIHQNKEFGILEKKISRLYPKAPLYL